MSQGCPLAPAEAEDNLRLLPWYPSASPSGDKGPLK